MKKILAALGKPTFSAEGVAIYQADCLDLMARLPTGSVDLTVTSPPYNIGKEYETIRSTEDYIEWSARWIRAVHAATASDGAFWLNLGYVSLDGRAKAIPLPYLLWDKSPFFL